MQFWSSGVHSGLQTGLEVISKKVLAEGKGKNNSPRRLYREDRGQDWGMHM